MILVLYPVSLTRMILVLYPVSLTLVQQGNCWVGLMFLRQSLYRRQIELFGRYILKGNSKK